MSIGEIGSKRTVFDIYPVRNKKILILVDPENLLGAPPQLRLTLSMITYLLRRGATVVIAASFGALTGIPLHLERREREAALEAFRREGGLGYTNFFAALPSSKKLDVLRAVRGLVVPSGVKKNENNTGKTALFGSLTTDQKAKAIAAVFPEAEFLPATSAPFVDVLREHLPECTVSFAKDCMRAPLHEVGPGEICVLENLRFYRSEASADQEERRAMAEVLASGIDSFVNDSFANAHALRASSVEVPRLLLHGAAGPSMDRELTFYAKFFTHPAHPIAIVVAGSLIPEKLQLIHSLVRKVDRILVAGAIAFPFLEAKGLTCGKAYPTKAEPVMHHCIDHPPSEPLITCTEFARKILDLCDEHYVDIVLPIDHLVAGTPNALPSEAELIESVAVPADMYALDCGPNTINLFSRRLHDCQGVFWIGPLGMVSRGFCEGTTAFATLLSEADLVVVVGGASTARIVHSLGLADRLSHVTSGGISCLGVLQGHLLPGVEALSNAVMPDMDAGTSVSELLRRLPLFMGCSSHQLKALAMKMVRRVHAQGDFIAYRGDRRTTMCVVAKGGLVSRYTEEGGSAPVRFISKGQAVGMYEFLTQAPAAETAQAATNDTVTYQLSFPAMSELMSANPDLATQLLQNISEPLRKIANDDYMKQQSVSQSTCRAGRLTRVPQPMSIPSKGSLQEDILYGVASTVLLRRLSIPYRPFSSSALSAVSPSEHRYNCLGGLLAALQRREGMHILLCASVLREVIYHLSIRYFQDPWKASALGAVAAVPLTILSGGLPFPYITSRVCLDEALHAAVLSVTPLVSYATFLWAQRRVEKVQQGRLSRPGRLIIMALVKILIAMVVFPIIYQRSFMAACVPLAPRQLNYTRALGVYVMKQILSVPLRHAVHMCLEAARRV